MTDLDAQVRDLRERITAAQRARARAEHERDTARAQAEHARAALRAEFGVSTVEEARAAIADLEHQLTTEIEALRADLDQIGIR